MQENNTSARGELQVTIIKSPEEKEFVVLSRIVTAINNALETIAGNSNKSIPPKYWKLMGDVSSSIDSFKPQTEFTALEMINSNQEQLKIKKRLKKLAKKACSIINTGRIKITFDGDDQVTENIKRRISSDFIVFA
jgi:hypothetical protein